MSIGTGKDRVRDFMRKACQDALTWAKHEQQRGHMLGGSEVEINRYILAEVGRRWNIRAQGYVEKMLNIHLPQPDGPDEE